MSPRSGVRLADATLRIDRMPVEGRAVALTPDDETRAALAEQLGISAVETLGVRMEAVRFRGGIRVTGSLDARIVQPCVVSFEPVTQEISEPIDRVFLPRTDKAMADRADTEVFVDLDGEDVPDHFEGTEVDLSDLVIETLALAIDPYPRAPGASVPADLVDDGADTLSPFARLKALKQDPEES